MSSPLLDSTGAILYSTQSLKPTLGYAAGEMTGRNVLELVHPDQRAEAAALLARLLDHPDHPVHTELQVRHKDGSWAIPSWSGGGPQLDSQDPRIARVRSICSCPTSSCRG